MEHIAETFEHNGYTVQIIADQHAESPDSYGDDAVFLITTRNRYFEVERKGFTLEGARDGQYKHDYHVFPLNAYIHGGVALSLGRSGQFGDPWDSGQIGYVLVQKRQGFRNIRKAAESLVEEWNMYLSGDVWGYVITDPDGDQMDSCWGHYGLKYAVEAAKEAVPAEPALVGGESEDLQHDATLIA